MRLKATIKVTFKTFLYSWKMLIFTFAIVPLVLAVLMGNSQKEVYKPEVNREKINITIVDEDNSKLSNSFKEIFKDDSMKALFNVTDKGDYVLTVPKNYEQNLLSAKETAINVNENKRVSATCELIIKSIIKEYGEKVTENIIIQNKIKLSNAEDKDKLYANVNESIIKLYEKDSFKTTILKGERVLTSMENQATTIITFMMFSMVMSCIAGYNLDKENGSFKRLVSTPMTKKDFFNLDLVIFFISSFGFGLIYILAFRVAGFAFKGINPINLLCILICQSILITAIAGVLMIFFNKKVANIVIIVLMYLQIILGGGFIPIKEIGNQTFKMLTNFAPGNIVSYAYRSCILTNSISSFSKELLLMLIISTCLYLISIIKINIGWEE